MSNGLERSLNCLNMAAILIFGALCVIILIANQFGCLDLIMFGKK